ncbi:hypothetical protein D9613_003359 [Agrocybe pediades]|uniref:F-box domain-containing protein n=1 Tax=Agrocybe pediades TaxID=84607 RepID=A0A8H4QPX9_9AGAR|nr:hypothetical protein D9613_003359 [Agrocybe pediades]
MRRSSRVACKKSQPSEQISEEDYQMEEINPNHDGSDADEQESSSTTRKRRGTKRKNAPTKAGNPAPKKRVRGTRGLLKGLLDMPMDILVEIFGHLNPLDLLHLTRTTKAFREFLLVKNADSHAIWKESIANVPGLPPCPEDMSEPRYTHLAFVNICHKCDKKATSVQVFWYLRLRLCKQCAEQDFEYRYWDLELIEQLPFQPLLDLLPYDSDFGTHYGTGGQWYHEYHKAEDKKAWLDNKVATQKRLRAHAEKCKIWLTQREEAIRASKLSVIAARKARILDNLKRLGWSEEIAFLEGTDEDLRQGVHPLEHPAVVKASRKAATDRVVSELEPLLVEHMQGIKKGRLRNERANLVRKSFPILQDVHQTYVDSLPANSIYPSVADVFFHPDVQEILNSHLGTGVKSEDFDVIRPHYREIVSQVMAELENQVIALIPSSCIPEGCNGSEVLQLSTITFTCECKDLSRSRSRYPEGVAGLRYPEILAHRCATTTRTRGYDSPLQSSSFLGFEDDICQDLLTIATQFGITRWNAMRKIQFHEEGFQILSDALKMCGRDPTTTTLANMESGSEAPMFECLTCDDKYEGRLIMPWDALVSHKWDTHSQRKNTITTKDMPFCLVNGTDAALARARLLEDQQRHEAARGFTGMICMHCKETGNTTDLAEHALEKHNLSRITEKDIARNVGHNTSKEDERPFTYYLWTPIIRPHEPDFDSQQDMA